MLLKAFTLTVLLVALLGAACFVLRVLSVRVGRKNLRLLIFRPKVGGSGGGGGVYGRDPR